MMRETSQISAEGENKTCGVTCSEASLAKTSAMKGIMNDLLLYLNVLVSVPMYSMILCFWAYVLMIYLCPLPWLRAALLLYIPHCVLDDSPSRGGWDVDTAVPLPSLKRRVGLPIPTWRLRSLCRNSPSFRGVAKFFRMSLVKTADLDPHRNYLFAYHPHGIIAMGCNTALNTNGCDFERVFPGIHRSSVALNASFFAPILREWMLMLGFVSADRSNLLSILTAKGPNPKSAVLVPGGAAEALHAHPGVFRLVLRRRRGFIRVALETGCSVVPCLGFGENEIFGTYYGREESMHGMKGLQRRDSAFASETAFKTFVHCVQHRSMKLLSFSIPVMTSILPHRSRVTVVVGAPIHFDEFKKSGLPIDDAVVAKYHEVYIRKLRELYDKHKEEYGMAGVELEII